MIKVYKFKYFIILNLLMAQSIQAFEVFEHVYQKYHALFSLSETEINQTSNNPQKVKYICQNYGGKYHEDRETTISGSNVYVRAYCSCSINKQPIIDKNSGTKCIKETISKIDSTFSQLNIIHSSCNLYKRQLQSDFKCPLHLLRYLEYSRDSFSKKIGIESTNHLCGISENKNKKEKLSLKNFENILQKKFNLNTPDLFMNKCLSGNQAKKYSVQEKKSFIGKYYINSSKLQNKLEKIIKQIEFNSLGIRNNPSFNSWKKLKCNNMTLKKLNSMCYKFKHCHNKSTRQYLEHKKYFINRYVKSLAFIYPKYQAFDKKLSKLQKRLHTININGCFKKNCHQFNNKKVKLQKEITKILNVKKIMSKLYPTLKGSVFKKHMPKNISKLSALGLKISILNSLEQQKIENQENLFKKFKAYKDALSCLNSMDDIKCENFEHTIASLDDYTPDMKMLKSGKNNRQAWLDLSKAECSNNNYFLQKDSMKTSFDTFSSLALLLGGNLAALGVEYLNVGKSFKVLYRKMFNRKISDDIAWDTDISVVATKLNIIANSIRAFAVSKTAIDTSDIIYKQIEKCQDVSYKKKEGMYDSKLSCIDTYTISSITNRFTLSDCLTSGMIDLYMESL